MRCVIAVCCLVFSFPSTLALAEEGLAAIPGSISGFPEHDHFYARDDADGKTLQIRGTLKGADWKSLELRITRQGQRFATVQSNLDDLPNQGKGFALSCRLVAGLAPYTLSLSAETGQRVVVLAEARGVLVGDVFLIQGQSNAVALDYHSERRANAELQRPWIRSFGTASTFPSVVEQDQVWHLADGERSNDSGTIGSWGLRMAQVVSEGLQLPVGVINGAVGGTPISYHQRNDDDPEDLSTNYGRLLWRARQAGVAESARALIWYQGESDGDDYQGWARGFRRLYDDWHEDFPGAGENLRLSVAE